MKKCSLILLVLSLVLSQYTMISCESTVPPKEPAAAEGTESVAETAENPLDENGFLKDDLPVDLDLGGKDVTIYVRGDTLDTEFYGELTGEIVSDALYNRNLTIEERLNTKLTYFANTSADFWTDRNLYMDTVRSAVMSNDNTIDLIAGLSVLMPMMTQEGLFRNLMGDNVPYLDYEKPWWPAHLIDELAISDRLYFVSGEASLGVIKGMMCYYFNQDMITDLQLDNPYDLVSEGTWTLDTFNEMAVSAYVDHNGDGNTDENDQFGFVIQNENHATNFVNSSGLKVAQRDDNGIPQVMLGSEAIINLTERFNGYMKQPGFATKADQSAAYSTMFQDNLTLFATGEFGNAETYRETEFTFGIIPFPKYSAEQSEYVTSARSTFSGFAVPVSADLTTCAAVLEALASESYRQVTPAYYESALKTKYSRDDISAQMFDLIKAGVCYDFGIIFAQIMDSPTVTLRGYIGFDRGSWATQWASIEKAVNNKLSEYIETVISLKQ